MIGQTRPGTGTILLYYSRQGKNACFDLQGYNSADRYYLNIMPNFDKYGDISRRNGTTVYPWINHDVFGKEWKNHVEKIEKNWIRQRIRQEDTVAITGDHSGVEPE